MTENYYEGQDSRPSRGILSGFLVVMLLSILLVSGVTAFLYQQCTAKFWQDNWLYPNATVIDETSQILSTQPRVLLTSDSPEEIDTWYSRHRAELTRAAVESGNFSEFEDIPDYSLVADPQGNGTRIIFNRTCP